MQAPLANEVHSCPRLCNNNTILNLWSHDSPQTRTAQPSISVMENIYSRRLLERQINVLSTTELNAVKHLHWYVNCHTNGQCHCCCSHCHHHHQNHDQHHKHHQCHCYHKHQHHCAVRKFSYFMPCCGCICPAVSPQNLLISNRYNDYIKRERERECVCVCLCVCVWYAIQFQCPWLTGLNIRINFQPMIPTCF